MQSATLFILRHTIQKRKEKPKRKAKILTLLQQNPQKFINPFTIYMVLDDIFIIEDLMKSTYSSSDRQVIDDNIMAHSVLNKFKYLVCTIQSQNNQMASFYVENRPNQMRLCWSYIVERLKSFGKKNLKELADIISDVHQDLQSDLDSTSQDESTNISDQEEQQNSQLSLPLYNEINPLSCCKHSECKVSNQKIINMDIQKVQSEMLEVVETHFKNKPVSLYQMTRGQFQFATSQLGSIHMSKELLALLRYDVEEFCLDSQKHGFREIFGQSFYEINANKLFQTMRNFIKAAKENDIETLQKMGEPYIILDEFITKDGIKFAADIKISRIERDLRYYIVLEIVDVKQYPNLNMLRSKTSNYELTQSEFSYLNHYSGEYNLKNIQKSGKICGYKILNQQQQS